MVKFCFVFLLKFAPVVKILFSTVSVTQQVAGLPRAAPLLINVLFHHGCQVDELLFR